MKTHRLIIFFLPLLAMSCFQKEGKPQSFDYGRVENNKYTNTFFDFEMSLPSDWSVQSQEQLDKLANKGKEFIAGDDEKLKAVLKASDINTANLLAVYQYELGSPVDFNPSIVLVAENVTGSPGIKSGSDYLYASRRLLEQAQMKYDHIDEIFEKEVIGGIDFYKMNAEMSFMGRTFRQTYYSTILNGFSFNAIISFANEEQKTDLLKLINSMKFRR